MQTHRCISDILSHKNTIDFSSYNLLRPDFVKWVSKMNIFRQETYISPEELLGCISRIPEIRIINNLILPNWIINTKYDLDYVMPKIINNPKFWELYDNYTWIDGRNIHIYQSKWLQQLSLIIIELLKNCEWLLISVPQFMTLTEFWDWLFNCPELNDNNRERIIFFTPIQAKIYKTSASGGSIPLDIAKQQHLFYKNVYYKQLFNTRGIKSFGDTTSCLDEQGLHQQPIIIQELEKLKLELMKYNLEHQAELEIETGGLLEKINEIRDILGIPHN